MERFRAWLIGLFGYLAISIIGRTVRWETQGDSYLDEIHKSGHRAIFAFWHGRIFLATYFFRGRGIAVMTSMNRDPQKVRSVMRAFRAVCAEFAEP